MLGISAIGQLALAQFPGAVLLGSPGFFVFTVSASTKVTFP